MVTSPAAAWTEAEPAERARLAVDGVQPRYVARPGSVEELADVLREVTAQALAVAPRGGGTQLGLGSRPARLDVMVETKALDQVVEYEPADLTVTVQAGMRFDTLQALLGEQGQRLALDPPHHQQATIGGLIATNASGPLRFGYGTARDLVIGTRVANADGRLTRAGGRVVKNVAGYDLNKLYVGSLGTLGVIVELSFKLAPIPPSEALLAGRFPDAAAARAFLGALLHSPLSPMAVELLGPSAAEAADLERGLAVVVRVGGYGQAVQRQERDIDALILEHGGRRAGATEGTWEAILGLALDDTCDVLLKAAAPIARSADLIEMLERILQSYEPRVWAHAGNGVAYAACRSADDPAALAGAIERARSEVVALGGNGSLVVERCPVALKEHLDVWGEPGESVRLMRALKQQLDPAATLNPGRYVGGI